jgi:hypothetical protein
MRLPLVGVCFLFAYLMHWFVAFEAMRDEEVEDLAGLESLVTRQDANAEVGTEE